MRGGVITSPMGIKYGKRLYSLNLNIYRNLHYKVLNRLKVKYKEVMEDAIKSINPVSRCRLVYVVYKGDKRRFDVANICAVHDKFFCDAMVELGRIPDDSCDYIPEVVYKFGGIDKANPRVDIYIEEVV